MHEKTVALRETTDQALDFGIYNGGTLIACHRAPDIGNGAV